MRTHTPTPSPTSHRTIPIRHGLLGSPAAGTTPAAGDELGTLLSPPAGWLEGLGLPMLGEATAESFLGLAGVHHAQVLAYDDDDEDDEDFDDLDYDDEEEEDEDYDADFLDDEDDEELSDDDEEADEEDEDL
ncbi:MAG: hypothetical protein KatS3mg103_0840 [Phycisphaerales bacterium]|nr:MAG: hypothetical protein KatS3mg103_0840 [Phycisphaerales bacterium]